MEQRGEWCVPFFNGAYRLDKPPLIYWLMALSFRIFGVNELGARAPSIFLSALLCLLVFFIGRSLFGLRAGAIASFSLATSLQILIHGRLAVADMPMIVSVALAQWAILRLLEGGKGPWFWILWIALGIGFLAKGPIAWAVPLVTLLLWRLFLWRHPIRWRRLHLLAGSTVMIGIVSLWAIPALLATRGAFWTQGIGEHVFRRGVEAFDGRPHFWGYYLVSSLVSLFPWSAFLGWVVLSLRENFSFRSSFLLAWFLAPFLLFTPYATQLPHYLLPGFPAFFLLLGQAATKTRPRSLGTAVFWSIWGVGLLGGSFAVWATFVRAWDPSYHALRLALWAVGGVFLSLCLLALVAKTVLFGDASSSPRDRPFRIFPFLALGIPVLALAGAFWLLGSSLRTVEPALSLRGFWKDLPGNTVYVAAGYTEPSLVFYSRRQWVLESDESPSGLAFARTEPACFLRLRREIPLKDGFRWLFSGHLPERDLSSASSPHSESDDSWLPAGYVEGFDSARFSWVILELRLRPGAATMPPASGSGVSGEMVTHPK
ncbi:Undecaprenyl phosphate-alpha-4-amino-4-deoxy-L-arabinose arabinosyl transferase [Methylacidimicrobium cyclopophantes]|uniref:Undecaprenyl phosphate-alpha-4-amino-4-deoxy-L-arabinose arabinosyl transferase n=2 Tax=Methylacidimicrobium cyclopophantes TaxID=1041766 RepID=A0A5E6M8W5_9BACT|nr:Undecaprenyl phosphate-alpha-4-amino-4-deoxy-L-arabinose arabinosyl transferase [Methylacidimicrobium cyclopophantes]